MKCPHCGLEVTPKARKAKAGVTDGRPVDTASMTTAELYAHYKRTAPLEDCRFFARNIGLSPEVHALAAELVFDVQNGLSRSDTYKRLTALQARWRIENYYRRVIVPAKRIERGLRKANARSGFVTAVSTLEYAYK